MEKLLRMSLLAFGVSWCASLVVSGCFFSKCDCAWPPHPSETSYFFATNRLGTGEAPGIGGGGASGDGLVRGTANFESTRLEISYEVEGNAYRVVYNQVSERPSYGGAP